MAGHAFIEHQGKKILRLDYTGLTPPETIALTRKAQQIIAAQPHHPVRLLSVAPGRITSDVIGALKDFAAKVAPFVLASAVVGASPFVRAAILLTIVGRGRFHIEAFDNEGWAKDWLATT